MLASPRTCFAEWRWTERYPAQPEILRYLNHVADRFDLRRSFRFNARVVAARWDGGSWHVETQDGARHSAPFLITAVGCLSSANVPAIPGLADFAGAWYHTGEWPHGGVDFHGRRVGMIGTGSTGIQAAPVIAETAAHLAVFQRTANYSVPARNAPLTPEFQAWVQRSQAEIRATMHDTPNGHPFRIAERDAFDVSAAERQDIYEAAWEKGGLQFRAAFRDLLADKAANDTAAGFIKGKIREIVRDPRTAAVLADIDHPYAAKRPPIDTGYFETFNRANVTLVDVRADPIARIVPAGIELRSGARHPLDIIVFATGFDAMTGPLLRMNLTGRDGLTLAEAWRAGPATWLGLQVPGFPNLFTLTGPGSPSVLCNMPVAIEQHVEWVTACIAHLPGPSRRSTPTPKRPRPGPPRSTRPPTPPCCRWPAIPGTGRQRPGQAAHVHALCRRHETLPRPLHRHRRPGLPGLPPGRLTTTPLPTSSPRGLGPRSADQGWGRGWQPLRGGNSKMLALCSLSRVRERVGVRVAASLSALVGQSSLRLGSDKIPLAQPCAQ